MTDRTPLPDSLKPMPVVIKHTLAGCRISAGFEGKCFRLAIEWQGDALVGRFMCDRSMWVRVAPAGGEAVTATIPLPAKPAPEFALNEEDVSPLPLTLRRVRMDETGGIDLVTWVALTPEQFNSVMKRSSGPIVPARQHKVPFGRCDEYYDRDGRLCRTVWTTAPTAARRAS
jgi:hypothetical protein